MVDLTMSHPCAWLYTIEYIRNWDTKDTKCTNQFFTMGKWQKTLCLVDANVVFRNDVDEIWTLIYIILTINVNIISHNHTRGKICDFVKQYSGRTVNKHGHNCHNIIVIYSGARVSSTCKHASMHMTEFVRRLSRHQNLPAIFLWVHIQSVHWRIEMCGVLWSRR